VSPTYKEIKSFAGTSEYKLLEDNQPKLFKFMKTLKEYDVNKLKKYDLKMYEKRYREWEAD